MATTPSAQLLSPRLDEADESSARQEGALWRAWKQIQAVLGRAKKRQDLDLGPLEALSRDELATLTRWAKEAASDAAWRAGAEQARNALEGCVLKDPTREAPPCAWLVELGKKAAARAWSAKVWVDDEGNLWTQPMRRAGAKRFLFNAWGRRAPWVEEPALKGAWAFDAACALSNRASGRRGFKKADQAVERLLGFEINAPQAWQQRQAKARQRAAKRARTQNAQPDAPFEAMVDDMAWDDAMGAVRLGLAQALWVQQSQRAIMARGCADAVARILAPNGWTDKQGRGLRLALCMQAPGDMERGLRMGAGHGAKDVGGADHEAAIQGDGYAEGNADGHAEGVNGAKGARARASRQEQPSAQACRVMEQDPAGASLVLALGPWAFDPSCPLTLGDDAPGRLKSKLKEQWGLTDAQEERYDPQARQLDLQALEALPASAGDYWEVGGSSWNLSMGAMPKDQRMPAAWFAWAPTARVDGASEPFETDRPHGGSHGALEAAVVPARRQISHAAQRAVGLLALLANACASRGWNFEHALRACAPAWSAQPLWSSASQWMGPTFGWAPWLWRDCVAQITQSQALAAQKGWAQSLARRLGGSKPNGEDFNAWRAMALQAGMPDARAMDEEVFERLERLGQSHALKEWPCNEFEAQPMPYTPCVAGVKEGPQESSPREEGRRGPQKRDVISGQGVAHLELEAAKAKLWMARNERNAWARGAGERALLGFLDLALRKIERPQSFEEEIADAAHWMRQGEKSFDPRTWLALERARQAGGRAPTPRPFWQTMRNQTQTPHWSTLRQGAQAWLREREQADALLRWTPLVEGIIDCGEGFVARELHDGTALAQEGRAQRHCVGGYSEACMSGRSRIFALEGPKGERSTVEVKMPTGRHKRLRVVQHRRAGNLIPGAREKSAARALEHLLIQKTRAGFAHWLGWRS
jgi:hypothetical protein